VNFCHIPNFEILWCDIKLQWQGLIRHKKGLLGGKRKGKGKRGVGRPETFSQKEIGKILKFNLFLV
jgi:hypothetical protein